MKKKIQLASFCSKDSYYNIYQYYKNSERHRYGDLPDRILKNDNIIIYEAYWKNNQRHRDGNLPGWIERNNNGVIIHEHFYINDQLIQIKEISDFI